MKRETKTTTIGNHEYTVEALGSKEARKLFFELLRVLGPTVGAGVAAGASFRDLLSDASGVDLGAMLRELPSRLTEKELDNVLRLLGEQSTVDDRPLTLEVQEEVWAAGHLKEMLSFLRFALEFQFRDFLTA